MGIEATATRNRVYVCEQTCRMIQEEEEEEEEELALATRVESVEQNLSPPSTPGGNPEASEEGAFRLESSSRHDAAATEETHGAHGDIHDSDRLFSSDSEDGTFGALANVVPKEDGLAVLGNTETGVQRGLQQGGHGKKKLKQGNLFAMMGGRPTPPSRPGGAGVVGKSQQASIFSMLGGRGSALSTGREGRAAGARWVSMTRAC